MPTRRRQQFIVGNMAWLLGTVLALSLLGSLSLELFFVVSLIGFLVVVELTAPFAVTPTWRRRLKWLIAVGLVVFGYIVVRRILAILPPGVVP
jgi:dolichyl-phosphate-mannose--protein O-mannosyl transferase